MEIQLQRIRKSRKLDQQQMADLLGVKKRTYGSWERGEAMLSLEQAYNCALVLGCTIDEIAGYEHAGPAARFADPYQAELHECYEASTPEGRSVILGTARGQRELSLKASERGEPQAEGIVNEAV